MVNTKDRQVNKYSVTKKLYRLMGKVLLLNLRFPLAEKVTNHHVANNSVIVTFITGSFFLFTNPSCYYLSHLHFGKRERAKHKIKALFVNQVHKIKENLIH